MADRSAEKYGFMILPDGKRYSLDDRQTRLNNNVLVVGTTGASKTRTVITPNLLECVGSYVLTDPKEICTGSGDTTWKSTATGW